MAYDLDAIYHRTSGYCHLCGLKIAFMNYGRLGDKGAWEVEHSYPRSRGGTHHGNNLYGACIPCNREKGSGWSTRTVRSWNGRSRAPLSRAKRQQAKQQQSLAGAVLFGAAGSAFGTLGFVIGALLGAAFGERQNPDYR